MKEVERGTWFGCTVLLLSWFRNFVPVLPKDL